MCMFLGSTDPSSRCTYSIVTRVVPSRRNHHHQRSPFSHTSVHLFLSRVAMECVCVWHGVLSLITCVPERGDLVASTDVKIILAVNAAEVIDERVESDVLYCASRADPCEMESLAVGAHISHCCVSVGLLSVLHLRCTRDELDLDFSMLPWHSMAAVRCQVLLGPRIALSALVLPIPLLRGICLWRLKNLTEHMRHSCAVVLWVRAVHSDCLPLLPAAQI